MNDVLQQEQETYQAYVSIIIPRSPELAEEYGKIQYYGALDFKTDEYLVLTLNSLSTPMALPVAEVLDIASEQLVILDGSSMMYEENFDFSTLSPTDRFRTILLLKQNQEYFVDLLSPSQHYPEYIFSIISNLNRYIMMGYYSEWFGYGTTRLNTPDERKLEFYPLSWKQVGYPGPSLGYRALRNP